MTAIAVRQNPIHGLPDRLRRASTIIWIICAVLLVALIPPIIHGGKTLFLQRTFDAMNNGAVYAVTAIALVLIFKATTLINFAQANIAMFGAYLCWQSR